MRAVSCTLLLALACLALPAPSRAQGGYTTEKHPDLGLTFPRARDYEQVPTQPDEPNIVLHFVEKLPPDAHESSKPMRPEIYVLWIDRVPDPPDVAPHTGGSGEPPPAPEGTGKKEKEPKSEPKPPLPINSFERFAEQRMPEFKLKAFDDDKRTRQGWAVREYTLTTRQGKGKGKSAMLAMGWAVAYSKPERTIVFCGVAAEDEIDKQTKIWHAMSDKVDFSEPEALSTSKIEMLYARSKYIDIPFRIGVRKKLVRGWQAQDLDDYIVVYDTPDQPLMRKVFRDLELIRKEYERLFPPEKPITVVSTVRVCKNREEYLAYGGMPMSAGFWNSQSQELVLYDAEKVERDWKKSDADTFIVLYHEAFHQFIHYSAGELPPHPWFNEGTGDFFSGALLKDGKMRGIGANPWRLPLIQAVIEKGMVVPFKDILHFEQKQYYENPAVCYAEGWSIIYFLRTCKQVASRPDWARILPTYFDELKTAYAAELAKLDEKKKADPNALGLAGLAARNRAVDAAFQGVDLNALEEAWSTYISALPLPDKR